MTNRQAGEDGLDAAAVADLIRRIPLEEGLKPGARIGAERELAERFHVSRWTVRRALGQLEAEGAILKTTNGRGGGVFVPPGRVVRDSIELVGLPQILQSQGMQAETIVLGTQTVASDENLAASLQVDVGSWVYQIDRLRLAENLPLAVETAWLPIDLFPGLLNHSLVGSIFGLLESEYGIERGEAVETITSRGATRDQAAALQVPVGAPLLVVDRIGSLTSGQAFEKTIERFRGDRVDIAVHTVGPHVTQRRVT